MEHIKFKNIPFDGDYESFIERLEDVGFEQDEYGRITGMFANLPVDIFISTTPLSHLVYCVSIAFSQDYDLEDLYTKFKDLYTKKYGKPIFERDCFSDPSFEGDDCESTAIENSIFWMSVFDLGHGEASITFDRRLWIRLTDNANKKINEEEIAKVEFDDI